MPPTPCVLQFDKHYSSICYMSGREKVSLPDRSKVEIHAEAEGQPTFESQKSASLRSTKIIFVILMQQRMQGMTKTIV